MTQMNLNEANKILNEAFTLNVSYLREFTKLKNQKDIEDFSLKKLNELQELMKRDLNVHEIFNLRVKILALELGKTDFKLSSNSLAILSELESELENEIKIKYPEVFI